MSWFELIFLRSALPMLRLLLDPDSLSLKFLTACRSLFNSVLTSQHSPEERRERKYAGSKDSNQKV